MRAASRGATRRLAGLINLALNLNCYRLETGIGDTESLGWKRLVGSPEYEDMTPFALRWFDFPACGHLKMLEEVGSFHCGAYYVYDPEQYRERYTGPQDLPEHFYLPELYGATGTKGKPTAMDEHDR